MAVLEILTYPNKELSKKSEWIDEINDEIVTLAMNMIETMFEAPGIGLAAPQVGVLKRMIVVDLETYDEEGEKKLFPKNTKELLEHSSCNVFINPEVIEASSEIIECEEGCLSVPTFTETVSRPSKIKVNAQLLDGTKVEFEAEDLFSVCIQHEIDHLDGKLFIDRISSLKRNIIKNKITKKLKEKNLGA
jgi:peptide deformylase